MEDLPISSTCPNLLKNQASGKRAGAEYMPLSAVCAIGQRRAGALRIPGQGGHDSEIIPGSIPK
jgi:hypothetical protein